VFDIVKNNKIGQSATKVLFENKAQRLFIMYISREYTIEVRRKSLYVGENPLNGSGELVNRH